MFPLFVCKIGSFFSFKISFFCSSFFNLISLIFFFSRFFIYFEFALLKVLVVIDANFVKLDLFFEVLIFFLFLFFFFFFKQKTAYEISACLVGSPIVGLVDR